VTVSVSDGVSVPGELTVTANVAQSAPNGDATGFVILTHDGQTRRIPFWVEVNHPLLRTEPAKHLSLPGVYRSTTVGGESKVSHYRYPTKGDGSYPGPEVAYLVHVSRPIANFGVAVLSGSAIPHVVFAGDENHLAGFTGLPTNLNPYLETFGEARTVAGADLPAAGNYEIVFDTRSARSAGPFSFRYWVDDTTPPKLRVVSTSGRKITVAITDGGAGVDPLSVRATLDGRSIVLHFSHNRLTLAAGRGRHLLIVTASDYQELKNMEDVAPIKPNTSTLRRTVTVR
jgi:hypothetical protein